MKSIRIVLVLLVCVVLASCGAAPKKDNSMAVEIRGAPHMNPDADGRASPAVVYVVALRALGNFDAALLVNLMDDPAGALKGDLIAFRQVTILPGEIQRTMIELTQDTRHIGVIASLRNFQGVRWKDSIEVPSKTWIPFARGNRILTDVGNSGVKIEVSK